MSTKSLPTYRKYVERFFSLPLSDRLTISASLSATECWLYNIQVLPTERDIRILHQAFQYLCAEDSLKYLDTLPLTSQFFQCYAPVPLLLRLMVEEFKRDPELQEQFRLTAEGLTVTKKLFERCVGFSLGQKPLHLGFARLFATHLLNEQLPQNFDCPPELCAYEEKRSWELMEYPKNFVFHNIRVADMPESEKRLLLDTVRNNTDPEQTISWFHHDPWIAGCNPVDAQTDNNSCAMAA